MPDLADGESIEMQGSGKAPYVIKNIGGVYSCSCPAWRNQSIAIETRTCKHIRKLRGDAAETARIGNPPPARAVKVNEEAEEEAAGPPLLLAHSWENDVDLTGWWISEKLDGVRAYWDGKKFLSRQGNEFRAPDWFVAGLPETPLDGELWLARKAFQRTVSIVRRQDRSDHWQEIRYLVFDAPAVEEPFEKRMKYVEQCVREIDSKYVGAHTHERCKGAAHLKEELARVESLGGEGLMLRQPESRYETCRSTTLLKVKTFHDAEAIVVDHVAGKGRHKGRLGALEVQLPDGTRFSVGTGLSDKQRSEPPAVGSTITFRYQELSDGGVPRFPSFVRLFAGGSTPAPAAAKVGPPAATKSTVKSAAKPSKPGTKALKRYFEFVDDRSSKFWEIAIDGLDVTVRYGRIGTNGQTSSKSFASDSAAQAHADKLIEEKTEKGYEEKEGDE